MMKELNLEESVGGFEVKENKKKSFHGIRRRMDLDGKILSCLI